MTHPEVVFIDVEASALHDGYPIEVGWAIVRDFRLTTESWLIRPTAGWLKDEWRWSYESEKIHKIGLHEICMLGRPVPEVRARMTELFAGKVLFSDAVGFDLGWLLDLYHAEAPDGTKMPFGLADISAAFAGSDTDEVKFEREERKRRNRYAAIHRAADDALNHALQWCHTRRGIEADRFDYPQIRESWAYLLG